jgi:hypothetical protein
MANAQLLPLSVNMVARPKKCLTIHVLHGMVPNMKLTMPEQLQRAFRIAAKKLSYEQRVVRRVETPEMRYYRERMGCSACVSFETFIASWAGQEWSKRNEG